LIAIDQANENLLNFIAMGAKEAPFVVEAIFVFYYKNPNKLNFFISFPNANCDFGCENK
jgi:hypothetical protein